MKVENAIKKLDYSSVASLVLMELYKNGATRSSMLVSSVESKATCSRTLIYQVLGTLRDKELISLPTDRKRMKFYALTDRGNRLVRDEIEKNVVELRETARSTPSQEHDALDMVADGILNQLPSDAHTSETRMLIRRKLANSVNDLKKEMLSKARTPRA